jgi:hypothetical protein
VHWERVVMHLLLADVLKQARSEAGPTCVPTEADTTLIGPAAPTRGPALTPKRVGAQKFRHTPYATNAYVLQGPKARAPRHCRSTLPDLISASPQTIILIHNHNL